MPTRAWHLVGRSVDQGRDRGSPGRSDIVHLEIAAALERDILVIPILVEDAAMPRRQQLPENLVELAGRNAHKVRHESFRSDTDRILAAIDPILRPPAAAPRLLQISVVSSGLGRCTFQSEFWRATASRP